MHATFNPLFEHVDDTSELAVREHMKRFIKTLITVEMQRKKSNLSQYFCYSPAEADEYVRQKYVPLRLTIIIVRVRL